MGRGTHSARCTFAILLAAIGCIHLGAQSSTQIVDDLERRINAQAARIQELDDLVRRQQAQIVSLQDVLRNRPLAEGRSAGVSPASAVQATVPTPSADPQPLNIRLGSATFTPLGFLELSSVYRSSSLNSGLSSAFGALSSYTPTRPTPALSETRLSAARSRLGFRMDTLVRGTAVRAYVETDFLGDNSAIASYSGSYTNTNRLALRQAWVDIDTRPGGHRWELMAGQSWSLLTPNRRGLSALSADVFYTQSTDPSQHVGLVWARLPEIRLVFHPNPQWAIGLAADDPQQFGGGFGVIPADYTSVYTSQIDYGPEGLAIPNRLPDFITKAAYDSKSGLFHIETAGLFRHFRVYSFGHSFESNVLSAALNTNVKLERVTFFENFFAGGGGSRYESGLGPDLAIKPDGSISPIISSSLLLGMETTSGNNTISAYFGSSYFNRNVSPDGSGFGVLPGTDSRQIREWTIGWNRSLWRSPQTGALSVQGQFSRLERAPWVLSRDASGNPYTNMVFISLRFTLPGSEPISNYRPLSVSTRP